MFRQIRRERQREGLSIHALAHRHGVHRRTVRQALASPLPPARERPEGRPSPKLGCYLALIDSWLEANREAPRKQRHTTRRAWERLRDERGADVAEGSVDEAHLAGYLNEFVRHEALSDRVGCKTPPPGCRSGPVKLRAA